MAGKTTDLVCLTPPPALKHAPTVSHAYLAMQIDRDANGEFHLPPFDPFLLQGQVIDVSIFTNQDARACFEGMISGNASLKQSWDKILAAVDYFKGQGNSDGKPDIISWGELVAGYQGRDQELRNAFINIKSASRILQERSMDDGLASFRAQMRRGMVLEAKGKLKEALDNYEAVFLSVVQPPRGEADIKMRAQAAFAAARVREKMADHLNDNPTVNGRTQSLSEYTSAINWYNFVPVSEVTPDLSLRRAMTAYKRLKADGSPKDRTKFLADARKYVNEYRASLKGAKPAAEAKVLQEVK